MWIRKVLTFAQTVFHFKVLLHYNSGEMFITSKNVLFVVLWPDFLEVFFFCVAQDWQESPYQIRPIDLIGLQCKFYLWVSRAFSTFWITLFLLPLTVWHLLLTEIYTVCQCRLSFCLEKSWISNKKSAIKDFEGHTL